MPEMFSEIFEQPWTLASLFTWRPDHRFVGYDNNKDDDYNSSNDLYLYRTLCFISQPLLLVPWHIITCIFEDEGTGTQRGEVT